MLNENEVAGESVVLTNSKNRSYFSKDEKGLCSNVCKRDCIDKHSNKKKKIKKQFMESNHSIIHHKYDPFFYQDNNDYNFSDTHSEIDSWKSNSSKIMENFKENDKKQICVEDSFDKAVNFVRTDHWGIGLGDHWGIKSKTHNDSLIEEVIEEYNSSGHIDVVGQKSFFGKMPNSAEKSDRYHSKDNTEFMDLGIKDIIENESFENFIESRLLCHKNNDIITRVSSNH